MGQLVLPSPLGGTISLLKAPSKISCFSFKLLFVLFWTTVRKVTNSAEPKERSPAKPGPHDLAPAFLCV